MITTSEIHNIIYAYCDAFGMEKHRGNTMPLGEVTKERCVVITKQQRGGKYWDRCYVEVNLCVPDIMGQANGERLAALERIAKGLFGYKTAGRYDGTIYRFQSETMEIAEAQNLRCHFVNVHILFETKNILE